MTTKKTAEAKAAARAPRATASETVAAGGDPTNAQLASQPFGTSITEFLQRDQVAAGKKRKREVYEAMGGVLTAWDALHDALAAKTQASEGVLEDEGSAEKKAKFD